jgi:NTE family protein
MSDDSALGPDAAVPGTPTRIALALGSGGARGYAHIGVIQVLLERGYQIVNLAGSSMGALVGGLHAAGALPAYTEWALSLGQFDVIRLLDPSINSPGAIKAEKVFAHLREFLGDVQIEDLPIPYTAVATDLLARKEVWFQRGPLDVAIRASIAIPSIITPVVLNGRLLVDGGLLNPVPIAPVAAVRADVVVAVSLHGDARGTAEGAPAAETAEARPIEEWGDRFRRGAARVLDSDVVRSLTNRFGTEAGVEDVDVVTPEPGFEELPPGLGRYDMMNLSIEAMQSVLTRYRFAGNPPDVLVSIPKDACRTLDFHRAAEMIELGRSRTTEALDETDLSRF